MKSILFVDDEPSVLRGLMFALRSYRSRWHAEFVSDGANAIRVLREREFDAIVTDLQMPQMDGNALLMLVMASHPNLVRIVLSGAAERAIVEKATELAHAVLDKPCSVEKLDACLQQHLGTV